MMVHRVTSTLTMKKKNLQIIFKVGLLHILSYTCEDLYSYDFFMLEESELLNALPFSLKEKQSSLDNQ